MNEQPPIETIEYKGCTIEVWQDEFAGNPFEDWDQLGSIVIERQRNASFATKRSGATGTIREISDPYNYGPMNEQDWKERIWEHHRDERIGVIRTFELQDYGSSGWFLSVDPPPSTLKQLGDYCGNINGYIYLSRQQMATEFKGSYIQGGTMRDQPPELIKQVSNSLSNELDVWKSWLNGGVLGYVLKSPDGTVIDSCWGYYAETNLESGYMISEAKEAADNYLAKAQEVADYGVAAVLGLTGGNA